MQVFANQEITPNVEMSPYTISNSVYDDSESSLSTNTKESHKPLNTETSCEYWSIGILTSHQTLESTRENLTNLL